MVDLGEIMRQAEWDALAIDALMDGYGMTEGEARKRYERKSAKVESGVLTFRYTNGGQLLTGEIGVKDD